MKPWSITTALCAPQISFAVEQLSALIQKHTGVQPVLTAKATPPCIALALDETLNPGVYHLNITKEQVVTLSGQDETALLHGCMDFINVFLPNVSLSHSHASPYFFHPVFRDFDIPETDFTSIPAVPRRGLWMWGHCIYDYRAMFTKMAMLKLNEIIIWNDFLPVNSREVVQFAHNLGIKVIWGTPWGWDTGTTKIDISDEKALAQAADSVFATFETTYASCGADGIYFQSFTETSSDTLNGKPIAQTVVEFVNSIAARILEKHPNQLLQFGLHATSVKNKLEFIALVDPRIEIIWEDCGAFPYAYDPTKLEGIEETAEFTEKMLSLRQTGGTGAVMKGMIALNWPEFFHQRGPYLLGCADEDTMQKKLNIAAPVWRYLQSEWMKNGGIAQKTISQFAATPCALYALAEDGVIEKGMPLPVALFAQMLWNPSEDFPELLRSVSLRPDVKLY